MEGFLENLLPKGGAAAPSEVQDIDEMGKKSTKNPKAKTLTSLFFCLHLRAWALPDHNNKALDTRP